MLNSMSTVVYNNHYIVSEGVIALMVLVYFMLAIVGFMTVVYHLLQTGNCLRRWDMMGGKESFRSTLSTF